MENQGQIGSNYDLESRLEGDGFIVSSDLHGNDYSLDRGMRIAKENNLVYVLNGDWVNDYHFEQVATKMGIKSQEYLFMEYASEKLDKKELETLQILSMYQQTGGNLEPLLQNVPQEHKEQAKKQLEDYLSYSQSEDFKNKMESTQKDFMQDKRDEIMQNMQGLQILYAVFMDEEAKRFAQKANEYGVTVVFNKGNHENSQFVEQVRQYLDEPNKIIDVGEYQGLIEIKQSNGQTIKMAGMTNCLQIMPYLQQLGLSQEQFYQLNSHMLPDELKSKGILQGEASQEDINKLEEIIKQDRDYHRITQGAEENFDVFLTHGQVGKPMMNKGRDGREVPYYGIAAYLSNLADLTIEGHIHSNYEGENSFGNNMIRAAGSDAAIIKKNEEGKLETKWVTIDDKFDGNHNNELPYSNEYLEMRIQDMVKQLGMKELPAAANDDEYEESKAA